MKIERGLAGRSLFIFIGVVFCTASCDKAKIQELESKLVEKDKTIELANQRADKVLKELDKAKQEKDGLALSLQNCEETEQGMWNKAISLAEAGSGLAAVAVMDELMSRYPGTSLKKDIEKRRGEITEGQRQEWKKVELAVKDATAEEGIALVSEFLKVERLAEQKEKAEKKQDELQKKYEETKVEREIEKEIGARVQIVGSGWKWLACDNEFMGPFVKVKVTNITEADLQVQVAATFFKGNEELGDSKEEIGGLFGSSLKPGKFQTLNLFPCWGSETDLIILNLPSVSADITVNGKPLKSVKIARKAQGGISF